MKRNISALGVRPLPLYTLLVAIGLAIGLYMTLSREDTISRGDRIEIGLAEVSPRGDTGGYAIPASGESVTLTASPGTVASGGASTLTYSLYNPSGHPMDWGCSLGSLGADGYYDFAFLPFFLDVNQTSGSVSTGPLTQTKTYQYTCSLQNASYNPADPWNLNGVSHVSTNAIVTVSTAVNGVCTNTSPTTRCTSGTFFELNDDTYYDYWQCLGSNGGTSESNTANCRAVSGRCAAANNTCGVGNFVDVADTGTTSYWDCTPPAGTFPGGTGGNTGHCSLPKTNGSCGSSVNSCTSGSLSDDADTATQNLWSCVGSNNGSTASCSSAKTTGVCGSSINTCSVGTFSDTADSSSDNLWSCTGANGGGTASCSVPKTSGSCGSSVNSCTSGSLSDDADTATQNLWSCVGSNNGSTASCSIAKVDGACSGAINGCTSGSFSDVADTTSANLWSCNGSNNGTNASCSVPKTNGSCGGSTNTCSSGSFVDAADTAANNIWSCTGSNNGTSASCSYPKTNAVCGSSINNCSVGTFNDDADDATYNLWHCVGSNNGTNASCSYPKTNGECGASINSCNTGTFSDVADNANENLWSCTGSNNGSNMSCTYPKTNGVCGSTVNSCLVGTFQDVSDSGTQKLWNCTGSDNGTTAACSIAFLNCSLDGATVNHGNSQVFYTSTSGTCDSSTQQIRTCNDGSLSGSASYQYASCTISPPSTSLSGRSSTMSSDRTAPDSFSVEPNETLSFSWSSQYVASCGITFGSSQAFSGSVSGVSVPAPGVASNYTLQCTGLNGTQSSKTFTIVTRERKPVLLASASRVAAGSLITLTYQMNGNTSCTFSGPPQINGRVVTGNGTTEGIPINGQTTFTLACPGGSNSVTVFINGSVQEQ